MKNIICRLTVLFLAVILSGCAGVRPNIYTPESQPAPKHYPQPRVALVLGGGGARGYAHIGVLLELERAGIPIDLVVGTSAGSFMGALYADSKSAEALKETAMSANFWDIADIANMPLFGGVMSGNHFESFLIKNLHAKLFKQLKVHFVAVTTDLTSGETYLVQAGPIPPAILASAAVPGVVKPVHLYEKVLVDGGVSNNVAVGVARKFHPSIIIAVDVSSSLSDTLPHSAFGIISRSFDIVSGQLTTLQLKGASYIIKPNLGDVGMFDLSDREKFIAAGQAAAKKVIPRIKRDLKSKGIS